MKNNTIIPGKRPVSATPIILSEAIVMVNTIDMEVTIQIFIAYPVQVPTSPIVNAIADFVNRLALLFSL